MDRCIPATFDVAPLLETAAAADLRMKLERTGDSPACCDGGVATLRLPDGADPVRAGISCKL